MSQQVHVLRLGPARKYGSYRDYKSGLYLTFPEKVEGTVPFGADLSNLYRSIKMKQLVDVNGTVVAAYEAGKQPEHAEAPAPAPAVSASEREPAEAQAWTAVQAEASAEADEAGPADAQTPEAPVEAAAAESEAKKAKSTSRKRNKK